MDVKFKKILNRYRFIFVLGLGLVGFSIFVYAAGPNKLQRLKSPEGFQTGTAPKSYYAKMFADFCNDPTKAPTVTYNFRNSVNENGSTIAAEIREMVKPNFYDGIREVGTICPDDAKEVAFKGIDGRQDFGVRLMQSEQCGTVWPKVDYGKNNTIVRVSEINNSNDDSKIIYEFDNFNNGTKGYMIDTATKLINQNGYKSGLMIEVINQKAYLPDKLVESLEYYK